MNGRLARFLLFGWLTGERTDGTGKAAGSLPYDLAYDFQIILKRPQKYRNGENALKGEVTIYN